MLNGIYNNLPEKIKYSLHLLGLEEKLWVSKNDKITINSLKNDYNVKFLPETQFLKLKFLKKNYLIITTIRYLTLDI